MNKYDVMALLKNNAGKRTLFGQHGGGGSFGSTGWTKYIESIKNISGYYPQIVGADVGYYWESAWINKLIDFSDRGGIVTISWHVKNPWTNGDVTDLSIGKKSDLWTTGTAAYRNFHYEMDRIAKIFLQMGDRAILFRPLHEMNGKWHWYENWNATEFIRLWREVYRYLVQVKRLKNLLFVYSPNRWFSGLKSATYYYPGSDVVNIVGLDHYGTSLSDVVGGGYRDLIKLGHPFAICEFGPGSGSNEPPLYSFDYSNLPEMIKRYCPLTTYLMAWNGNYSMSSQNGTASLMEYAYHQI